MTIKLSQSTANIRQPIPVLALLMALLRLQVRRAEQLEIPLDKHK